MKTYPKFCPFCASAQLEERDAIIAEPYAPEPTELVRFECDQCKDEFFVHSDIPERK